MKSHLKAYAFFLAFAIVTKAIVAPAMKQFGVPGSDLL